MPRVVITGGAGFIGSNLAEKLINSGYRVTVIDNLSHGSKANLDTVITDPNMEFIESDIRKPGIMAEICRDTDCIVHLAAYKIPRYGGALETLQINSDCTKIVFEAASQYNIKTILASTSDVYGKNPDPPFKESDNLVLGAPYIKRWAYAISKAFDEQLGMAYFTEKELPVVILRFFGSYGPRNNRTWWGGPQAVFIEQALQNKPLTVHGDGRQTRSFCYISDTVNGIVGAMESDKAAGEVINIGADQETGIGELAQIIIDMTNSESTIEYIPYENFAGRYEDVRNRVPDLAKAGQLLGFQPKISLKEGLQKTIAWHKRFPRIAG